MRELKKLLVISLIIILVLESCKDKYYIKIQKVDLTDYSKYLLDFYIEEIHNDTDVVIMMSIYKDNRDTTKKDIYVSIIHKEWQFCSEFIPTYIALYRGRRIHISGLVDTMFYRLTNKKIKLKKETCDSSYINLNYDPPMFYIVYDSDYMVNEIYNVTKENLLNYLKLYSKNPKLILTNKLVYNSLTE